MTDAPERIWLSRAWAETFVADDPRENIAGYVRADIHATALDQLAAAKAENLRLRGLVERARHIIPDFYMKWHDAARVAVSADLETCGKCMGNGYGGHPDSGSVCSDCGGAGGVARAALSQEAG